MQTPVCDTTGCKRGSVHVLHVLRPVTSLGIIRWARRLCPGCYAELHGIKTEPRKHA